MLSRRIFIFILAAIALIVGTPRSQSQFSGGGGNNSITQEQLDAAIAASQSSMQSSMTDLQSTVMNAIPQPGNVVPPTDNTTGSVGATVSRYMLQDAVRPARYRSGSCTLNAGQCTITWSTPFGATPNPLGDPSVVNTNSGTNMVQCNWSAISTTSGTVVCKAPALTLNISLGSLTLLPNAANGLVVAGTAVQPL